MAFSGMRSKAYLYALCEIQSEALSLRWISQQIFLNLVLTAAINLSNAFRDRRRDLVPTQPYSMLDGILLFRFKMADDGYFPFGEEKNSPGL